MDVKNKRNNALKQRACVLQRCYCPYAPLHCPRAASRRWPTAPPPSGCAGRNHASATCASSTTRCAAAQREPPTPPWSPITPGQTPRWTNEMSSCSQCPRDTGPENGSLQFMARGYVMKAIWSVCGCVCVWQCDVMIVLIETGHHKETFLLHRASRNDRKEDPERLINASLRTLSAFSAS